MLRRRLMHVPSPLSNARPAASWGGSADCSASSRKGTIPISLPHHRGCLLRKGSPFLFAEFLRVRPNKNTRTLQCEQNVRHFGKCDVTRRRRITIQAPISDSCYACGRSVRGRGGEGGNSCILCRKASQKWVLGWWGPSSSRNGAPPKTRHTLRRSATLFSYFWWVALASTNENSKTFSVEQFLCVRAGRALGISIPEIGTCCELWISSITVEQK